MEHPGIINFETHTQLVVKGRYIYAPDYGSRWFYMYSPMWEVHGSGDWGGYLIRMYSGLATKGKQIGYMSNHGNQEFLQVQWSMALAII